MDTKYDLDDFSIVPNENLSNIRHRSIINIFKDGNLPLMTAPMDTVVDATNYRKFKSNNIIVVLPRGEKVDDDEVFHSYGLNDLEKLDNIELANLPKRILIDVANGHMEAIYIISKLIKGLNPNIEIMVGNIANPETYRIICMFYPNVVDYIRVGIGGGTACLTAVQTGIFYPMGSLIKECFDIKSLNPSGPKIIADGGFRTYRDIIMGLSLGADYIMVGSSFNKALESCGRLVKKYNTSLYLTESDDIQGLMEEGNLFKEYRGMSTKEVQRKWNRDTVNTSEGIVKYNKVEYTLSGWVENFSHYLRSSMSYAFIKDIKHFNPEMIKHVIMTSNKRFNK